MPLFSIITSVYNNEKYMINAVRSVMNQDFDDYEYIIVDDGSTDHTPQIADRLAKENQKIQVIHQKNQWIYASFNNGVKAASGKYVYILNSDDILKKGILRKMADIVEMYAPDVIWTKVLAHKCDENQNIMHYDYMHLDDQIQEDMFFSSAQAVRENWFLLTRCNLNQNQANLYRRELMIKHPFRNDVYGADVLFNIAMADEIQTSFVMKDAAYDFMEYDVPERNASKGKYYPYLHEMFNDIYLGSRSLYKAWGMYGEEVKRYWAGRRIGEVTSEIYVMGYPQCTFTTEEKMEKALSIFEEDTVYECAVENGFLEELESRVLSGMKSLLLRENLKRDSRLFFLYELLESLLRYEKTDEDYEKIEHAVFHPLNKKNLGRSFYKKLKREENP